VVESEHEEFFYSMVKGHRLLPILQAIFKWGASPPAIRSDKRGHGD
jgi:hypothetical protein